MIVNKISSKPINYKGIRGGNHPTGMGQGIPIPGSFRNVIKNPFESPSSLFCVLHYTIPMWISYSLEGLAKPQATRGGVGTHGASPTRTSSTVLYIVLLLMGCFIVYYVHTLISKHYV